MPLSIQSLFDAPSNTFSYLLIDTDSRAAAIIDPVLDFDPVSGVAGHASADYLLRLVAQRGAQLQWILETHLHADHLTAAAYLREQTGARIGIGAAVPLAQQHFAEVFDAEPEFARDGSQFDRLLADGEQLELGTTVLKVMHTPGHTAGCVTYHTPGAAFVGDTLFMPDYGTARTDFPGGCAEQLFQSIQAILALPPETQIYLCHDYGTETRNARVYRTSVADQRANNIHLRAAADVTEFAICRQRRDQTLATPRLFYPSVQFNMRAGMPPPLQPNGRRYLKLPLRGY